MNLFQKIHALFRKEKLDAEMSDEMRTHLELQTRENISRGMGDAEARYAAQRQFGGAEQIKERARDARGFIWLEQMWQDVRYALRQLGKAPGFTAVVVLTLALGIGATTAIFSVVNTMILNPIAGPDPDRLVQIGQRELSLNEEVFAGVSPPAFEAIEAQRESFAGFTRANGVGFESRTDDFVTIERGASVPVDFFSVLDARPALGRAFLPGELAPLGEGLEPANDTVIVLSDAWWRSRFAGDPHVLGRAIELSGRRFTIVGVMPPYFQFPNPETQFWVPTERYRSANVISPFMQVIARLKPGASAAQTQPMLDTIARRLMTDYPAGRGYGDAWRRNPKGLAFWIRPLSVTLQDGRGARQLRQTLFGLLAAIGFVLLIVCANVANLTLARVERREHELAIRAALGAGRGRLMRQLLTEHLLLALLGGAAGVGVTAWSMKLLAALSNLPRLRPIEVDGRVLATGLVVSALTGLVFGLAPMWRGGRVRVRATLADGGANSTGGRQRSRSRGALVVVQIAVTVVLLTGAGLMLRSVVRLLQVAPGFDPENLLFVDVPLPWRKYEPARNPVLGTQLKNALFAQLHERFAALPGVKTVGFVQSYSLEKITVEGRVDPIALHLAGCGVEESDLFRALGVPLLAGRVLNRSDVNRKDLVVINDTLAHLCWLGESAIGKKIYSGGPKREPQYEVVGVVGDVRTKSFTEVVEPTCYRPYLEGSGMSVIGGPMARFALRASGDPRTLMAAVRRELKAAEPDLQLPVLSVADQVLFDSTRAQRTYRNYLAAFAGLGLLLSALGIYGVLAYAVARRTREIGIRIALGADRGAVFALVMGQGARLIAAGIGLGLIAAFWLTRFLREQLFNVSSTDPLVLGAVVVMLALVALLACWWPARRAAKVDPMVALRCE